MPQAPDAPAREGQVVFELERFAATRRDRCVVEGRWYGVRGRRFIRPTLALVVDGEATRSLADLVDKPWAAEDGERWRATFPLGVEIGDVRDAELTVAPDITVTLADSSGDRPRRSAGSTERSRSRSRRDTSQRGERELAGELERIKADKARTDARLDELLGQLSQAARERDQAIALRDQLLAERDAAQRERDEIASELAAARSSRREAVKANDAARVARDRALEDGAAARAARGRAESERDAAVATRDRAMSERDGALALRDHAVAERDAATAARDDAVQQRDALARTSERLQSELAEIASTRGAAMVMRRAAHERAASRHSAALRPAAVAILAVLAIVVLLIVVRAL